LGRWGEWILSVGKKIEKIMCASQPLDKKHVIIF
jgi:hypothetical protein